MRLPRLLHIALLSLLELCACSGDGLQRRGEASVERQPAVSLASGIRTASQSEPGLEFLAAEIEAEDRNVVCSVVFAKGDAAREINVNAMSGTIVDVETEDLRPGTRALVQELRQDPDRSPVSPVQAIEAALKNSPGTWAREARLESVSDSFVYVVTLVRAKEVVVARVSAETGVVQNVSRGLEDGEGREED